MMPRISRILGGLLIPCCAAWLCALQTPAPDPQHELAAGKTAAGQALYDDAVAHFSKANQLLNHQCSECYVWLARIELTRGGLEPALADAEKAIATAGTDPERSNAQLYRGIILSRKGDLAQAEAAFKAASAANPQCVECRFNLGFVLLKETKDAEGAAVLKTVAPEFSGTPRGREIERFIADPSRIRKRYAPEFSARLRNGEEINLDTFKGKVVLLDFWGIWCTACRMSLPLLKELAARSDPSKVAIVSIDEGDAPQKWSQFIADNSMTWAQVYDGNRSLYRAFGVDAFPRYFILSRDGIILEEFKGWSQDGKNTIRDAIARALEH